MNNPKVQITPEAADACVAQAVAYFKSGYNCSQSVVAAFAPYYGFTKEQAFRMSASFGGGIGRMRQTCGAACGMFLLAGLDCGSADGADKVPVDYTLIKNVKKPNNAKPGKVIYHVYNTIYVTPNRDIQL